MVDGSYGKLKECQVQESESDSWAGTTLSVMS